MALKFMILQPDDDDNLNNIVNQAARYCSCMGVGIFDMRFLLVLVIKRTPYIYMYNYLI